MKNKREDTTFQYLEHKRNITTDPEDIQRVRKGYYKQFYRYKFDKLGNMNQFLYKHKLPKWIQAGIENLNKLTTVKAIESII